MKSKKKRKIDRKPLYGIAGVMVLLLIVSIVATIKIKSKEREIPKTLTKNIDQITPVDGGRAPSNKPTQYIVLSFDGSKSIDMWEATRNFAKEMKQQNKPVNFTYFVSGVYFLTNKNKNEYQAPGKKVGASNIGFADSEEDITKRKEEMKMAVDEGNEIGSHLNGHFDGSNWNENDWKSELEQFEKLVPTKVVGIRTPLLARNKNLYKTLPNFGYKYDTSAVGKMGSWPVKDENGIWEIPLVTINVAKKSTLSMDYNLYLTQTNGNDILEKGTEGWNKAFGEVTTAYRNYFNNNYSTTRAPIVIADHFSTWNNGLYWEAMKSFAKENCGKPEVKCTTYSELVKYLETRH
jgi:hypothetical protein